jgi:sugar/nucleoside kinase (ribokinase family)
MPLNFFNADDMTKINADVIQTIISRLEENKILGVNAFLGFDACVDTIARVVNDKKDKNEAVFYNDSRQFGEFLILHENKSCGIELHTRLSKIGGNMVITGNALGNLGINSDCVGTFGYPDILPIFRSMSPNCKLYTVGDTTTTTALEFNDAKVMMFDPGFYKILNWDGIKNILGIDSIRKLFAGKQLVMLLNWSEIENSTGIWKGILDEVLSRTKPAKERPLLFTDFSDCSRRSKKEIQSAINLLSRFRKYFRVILSLNQNEAEIISKALDLPGFISDEDFINMLFNKSKVDEIVIHRTKDAMAYNGLAFAKCSTFFCKEPSILTGGGDNFNAGFCFSKYYNFSPLQSLIVANAVSGYYVKTGTSPGVENLVEFLKQKL